MIAMDRKFKTGDMVLYGTTGICEITDVTQKTFNRESAEYYVLTPKKQKGSTVFVPVNSEKLVSRMKKLLSCDEINNTIGSTKGCEYPWIDNDSERRKGFSETILSGDRAQIILMARALYSKRKMQIECGKKLHVADEKFLMEAERIINDEFSAVLGISPDEVPSYIKEEMNA